MTNVAIIESHGIFGCPVVGESHYQDALESICGGRTDASVELEVTARLILETDNPHDREAVRVDVQGRTVGYLSRADARSFRRQLDRAAPGVGLAQVQAMIRGGWDRGDRGSGHYGIVLDLDLED